MTDYKPDERLPIAIAMEWSARLMTIGLEMALPAGGGYWLDLHWHATSLRHPRGNARIRRGHVSSHANCTTKKSAELSRSHLLPPALSLKINPFSQRHSFACYV